MPSEQNTTNVPISPDQIKEPSLRELIAQINLESEAIARVRYEMSAVASHTTINARYAVIGRIYEQAEKLGDEALALLNKAMDSTIAIVETQYQLKAGVGHAE